MTTTTTPSLTASDLFAAAEMPSRSGLDNVAQDLRALAEEEAVAEESVAEAMEDPSILYSSSAPGIGIDAAMTALNNALTVAETGRWPAEEWTEVAA